MQRHSKILILSEVFYPEIGSGSNRITNLVIYLKSQGNKVDVITSEPSYPDKSLYENEEYKSLEKEEKLYENSNITRISGSKLKPTSNFIKRMYIYNYFLFKAIFTVVTNKSEYDLIISTMPSIFMGILGVVAKRKFKAKYIIDIRDLWPECIKNVGIFRKHKFALKIAYKLEKSILKRTNAVVVNSMAYKEYLENIGYLKPIQFIPNGLTKTELDDLEGIYVNTKKQEKFTVIYTGLIGLAQNIKTIVKVANHLRKVSDIQFRIIGTGVQTENVKALVKHYKLKNVEIIPPMPKEKVIHEIAKSHVAIAHLRKDSAFDLVIPGKLIDYMAIGIPIVAGVEGYTASILIDSKAGLAIEPDDCKELANAILHMYSDDYLRKSCSESGRYYCKHHFVSDVNFANYDELIDKILGRENDVEENMHVCMESLH